MNFVSAVLKIYFLIYEKKTLVDLLFFANLLKSLFIFIDTSYVKVNQGRSREKTKRSSYLNTSHVKVNPKLK